MLNDNSASSFEALEKQLAKDALEKALKDLHGKITQEIERNKKDFSQEIQKTLSSFRDNLEKNVSEEIDKKISSLFEKHFKDVSSQVKISFDEMVSPVLQKTEDDMQRFRNQGESTLRSWGTMMSQYESLWTKPFFVMFSASILTGIVLSLVFSYFLGRAQGELIEHYKKKLLSYENALQGYYEREKAKEAQTKNNRDKPIPSPKKKLK